MHQVVPPFFEPESTKTTILARLISKYYDYCKIYTQILELLVDPPRPLLQSGPGKMTPHVYLDYTTSLLIHFAPYKCPLGVLLGAIFLDGSCSFARHIVWMVLMEICSTAVNCQGWSS
jgi:hypothetical protein